MRAKDSNMLKELSTLSGKPAAKVSDLIISELIQRKVIKDTPENWGGSIFDAINEDVTEEQIAACYSVISETLGVYIKHLYTVIPDLDLIGDGDCPECGNEMEVTNGEYRKIGGDGYITPLEYTPIWEQKICSHCGYSESDEPDYEDRKY